jgi:hypothetical protein
MRDLLNPAISVGPVILGLGLLSAIVCIAIYLFAPGPKAGALLLRFVVVVLVVGIVAFVAGTAIGIAAFCSTADSGNLCGLGGVFGLGPLLSGLCVGVYAPFWLKRTRNAL